MSNVFKVVLLGEGRVGKTSLVSRFVHDTFDAEQPSTVQANMFFKKKIQIETGCSIDLSIWDTAGQERFHALGPIYYRGAHGAVLVYDITDRDTFQRVQHWVKELKLVLGDGVSGGSTLQLVICGNKCDREKDRDVELSVAEAYARKEGAVHMSTSAMTGHNVAEAFETLGKRIAKINGITGNGSSRSKRGGGGDEGSGGLVKKKKGGLKIADDGDEAPPPPPPAPAASPKKEPTAASNNTYDDYDDPPPKKPATQEGSTADKRRQTITLDKKKDTAAANNNNNSNGSSGDNNTTEKKKGGCCK